jgi:hypothetical protein
MNYKKKTVLILSTTAILVLACTLPFLAKDTTSAPAPLPISVPTATVFVDESNQPASALPTNTPVIIHVMTPSIAPSTGSIVYDVFSKDTAPEKRAPYGDSYDINRFERPFMQDMTYVSDMDIVTYNLSQDADWYYISVELISGNPNNSIEINYGVEIDNDADGFGDVIIWAEPPYTTEWTNTNVQVFEDTNHDTGGLSAELSDAPLTTTNGYDKLVFDRGIGDDPDLAWIRSDAGMKATIQFAFKKSLTDGTFMLGVLADAYLKDVTKLDYNDRFTAEVAGSPVRSNKNYPLGELYLFDNTCREAFGFTPSGYEPQLCPRPEPGGGPSPPGVTPPPPGPCPPQTCAAGCWWMGEPECKCQCIK